MNTHGAKEANNSVLPTSMNTTKSTPNHPIYLAAD